MINDTKVIPARLFGRKEGTDAHIEILLLKRRENDIWETLVKPGKKAKPGTKLIFGDGALRGEVLEIVEEGNRLIQFTYDGIFEEILDVLGEMPLPPYITHKLQDKNRYQTVYAKHDGSGAACRPRDYISHRNSWKSNAKGCPDCTCNAPRGTWHFPAGQGGRRDRPPYALGVLHRGRKIRQS